MSISRITIVILLLALLGSNAYWLYGAIDSGISYSYMNDSFESERGAADQLIAIYPVVIQANSTRDEIVEAARSASRFPDLEAFEKEGFVWVGDIGLKFSEEGRLLEVRRSWE